MKTNTNYKIRTVAGENIVLMQGKLGGDMTRVISFNETALMLWNALAGKDFTMDDVTRMIMDNYEVDEATAASDAAKWVDSLKEGGLLLPEA